MGRRSPRLTIAPSPQKEEEDKTTTKTTPQKETKTRTNTQEENKQTKNTRPPPPSSEFFPPACHQLPWKELPRQGRNYGYLRLRLWTAGFHLGFKGTEEAPIMGSRIFSKHPHLQFLRIQHLN